MRNLIGRIRRPSSRSLVENVLSLTNAGDGSTLSLDFTSMGGALDSRFTFSRSSTATFINSSGLVQYANSNMFVNTVWTDANNNPSQWLAGTQTGTVSRSNETRTLTCSSNQYWWYQQPASKSGLTYSASVEVTEVSGTLVYGDLMLAGSSTYLGWYLNGVLQATGTSTAITTGIITLIFTANSDNTILRLGLGTAGTNVTGSVTLRYPQFQPGQVSNRSYYENTSTSAARYDSARFDYDPTTLAPRGLLLEGSVTNLITYSNASTTGWTGLSATGSNDNATSPDGTTSATLWTGQSGGQNRAYSGTFNVTSGSVYTASAWFKKPTSNGSRYVKIYVLASNESSIGWPSDGVLDLNTGTASGTGFTVTAYSNNWYRVVSTGTANSTTTARAFISMCTSTGGLLTTTESMLVWGCQAEAGSAASSYIPTGASTAQRATDSLEITGTNFSSWWPNPTTEFSVQWIGDITRSPDTTQFLWLARAGVVSKARGYITTGAVIRGNSSVTDFLMSPATNAVANTVIKMAMAVKSGDSAMYVNDGTVIGSQTDATTGTTTNHDSLYLNPNGDNFMHIRSFKFWRSRLPNATLQTLVQ